MKTPLCLSLMSLTLLSGCSMMRNQNDPARLKQTVSVINAVTWTNPLSGKRDGVRTSWPLAQLAGHEEIYPLAQLRDCPGKEAAGAAPCKWGVLSASRTITRYAYMAGGITLDLGVLVDLHRRQQDRRRNFHTSMAIPADVPALQYRKEQQLGVALPYGKVYRMEFDYGVRFDICAQRLDQNGRALDHCDIPYI